MKCSRTINAPPIWSSFGYFGHVRLQCLSQHNINSADVKKFDFCCVMERPMKATLILDKTGKFLKDPLDAGKGKHRTDVAAPTFFLFFSLTLSPSTTFEFSCCDTLPCVTFVSFFFFYYHIFSATDGSF